MTTTTRDLGRLLGATRTCPLAEKKKTKDPAEAAGELVASVGVQFIKGWLLMLIAGALANLNDWPTAIGYGTSMLIVAAVNLLKTYSVRIAGAS